MRVDSQSGKICSPVERTPLNLSSGPPSSDLVGYVHVSLLFIGGPPFINVCSSSYSVMSVRRLFLSISAGFSMKCHEQVATDMATRAAPKLDRAAVWMVVPYWATSAC